MKMWASAKRFVAHSRYTFIFAIAVTILLVGLIIIHNSTNKKSVSLTNNPVSQSDSWQGTLSLGSPSDQTPNSSSQVSNTDSQALNQEIAQDEANYKKDEALAQKDEALAQQDANVANQGTTLPTTGTVQAAVSAPTYAPYATLGGSGGLSGSYYYAVTFVSKSGTETSLGPESFVVSPVNQEVLISGIPTSPSSGVTEQRLYRTKANVGLIGPYYLVTTFYGDSTTSYDDNTPDSSLFLSPTYE